ncbi:MAG: HAMP domain-containing protein [Lactobacillaceae bacterium]|jgi:signal transduction histidine kinase|nr:HAMP domain-containing protein [Lactobacillaceae bacterium]
MKYIGQLMLAFLTVVLSTVFVVSILFSFFFSQSNRQDMYSQMENSARSVLSMALNDDADGLSTQRVKQSEEILNGRGIRLTVYDLKNYEMAQHSYSRINSKILKQIKNTNNSYRHTEVVKKATYLNSYFELKTTKGKAIGFVHLASSQSANNTMSNPIRGQLLFAGLISMIIALIISLFMARGFSKKISTLRAATQQIINHNYSVRVPENRIDEIGELGIDINSMTRSLSRQQKEIKEQEERRKTFLSNASHEMRTPLTVLSGFLEAFENNLIKPADHQKYFLMMHNEVNRLTRLVKDNLDFERLRSSKMTLDIEPFNAYDVIDNVINQLKARAEAKQNALNLYAKKKTIILADQDRFTQLAINLITNAIQFTKNGHINVFLEKIENGVQFKVSDTGIGMSDKDKKNIFERYYKADPSRSKTEGESGLGMSIVKEIVEAHKGKIEVESQLGKGTTMIITLNDDAIKKLQMKNNA